MNFEEVQILNKKAIYQKRTSLEMLENAMEKLSIKEQT